MKNAMKKLCCIGLTFVFVLGLSACGAKEPAVSEKDPAPVVETEEDKKEVEQPEKEPEAEPEADAFVKGTIEGNHYENAWLNMQADFPDDYVMATAEEIAQMQQAGSDMLLNEDGQETMEKGQENSEGGTEMTAVNVSGLPNCTLAVEKLPMKNFTAEQYLEASKKLLEAGVTDEIEMEVSEEMPTVTIAGEDYLCLQIKMTVQGITMNSNNYVRIKDGYAIALNVTYSPETEAGRDEILDIFQPVQ